VILVCSPLTRLLIEGSARSDTWLEFLANSRTDTPLAFGMAFAVNLAIASVMSYLFMKDRSQYASYGLFCFFESESVLIHLTEQTPSFRGQYVHLNRVGFI
jgi:hypothetical protein